MIIHIIGQENFYQRNFIHFIERNFPSREHRFIFRSNTFKRINYKEETSIERKVSLISLILFTWQLFKAKKVFIHYLPYGPSLIFWTFYSLFSKNLVWVFWGGDIYIYQEKNRSLKTKFYEFFRKLLIRRLKNIAGFIKQDFEIIQKVYSTKAC